MNNISKFLQYAFNIILFALAITLLFMLDNKYNSIIDSSSATITGDIELFKTSPVKKEYKVTRADIIALLMSNNLDYDIEIIDESGIYEIHKDGYTTVDLESYILTSPEYTKTYTYTLNGRIDKIIFKY